MLIFFQHISRHDWVLITAFTQSNHSELTLNLEYRKVDEWIMRCRRFSFLFILLWICWKPNPKKILYIGNKKPQLLHMRCDKHIMSNNWWDGKKLERFNKLWTTFIIFQSNQQNWINFLTQHCHNLWFWVPSKLT